MYHNQTGSILPLISLILVIVLGLGALAVDISNSYFNQTKIKNAVDFATLAGISQLNGPATVTTAKNTALQYLNNNLSMNIPSFQALTLSSPTLSIQAGIYDFISRTFMVDEANQNVNALMITYRYSLMTFLGGIASKNNIDVGDTATVAKQPATRAERGSGFPLVIYSTALDTASQNGYMVNLYSAGAMDNSYWTDYTSSNPSTTDIRNVIDYFQTGMGTIPPPITVNDTFNVNDGGMGGVYMNLNPSILLGMDYLFAVVTPTMDREVMADGFLFGTIDNIVDSMGQKYISITIMPGYIDNTFGGLQITGTTNVSAQNQSALANGFGLVE